MVVILSMGRWVIQRVLLKQNQTWNDIAYKTTARADSSDSEHQMSTQ